MEKICAAWMKDLKEAIEEENESELQNMTFESPSVQAGPQPNVTEDGWLPSQISNVLHLEVCESIVIGSQNSSKES